MQRYDLISPRPRKDGKTYWHKVGAAFPNKNGGFSLVFDSLPLPDNEGRVSVMMKEPTPRDDQPRQQSQDSGQGGNDYGDEIPF